MKRRDWTRARLKVESEARCRVCKRGGGDLEAAHVIGRKYDAEDGSWTRVDPLDVVPLCRECHRSYDARSLSILEYLSLEEQAAAVGHVGIVRALKRLSP